MSFSRRQFLKLSASGVGATTLTALGFAPEPVLAAVRTFKLARTQETRNNCPYCSVGCGVILYTIGQGKNAKREIMHVEGDPDHPVNRGTLCPKGAALLDFIHSPNRLKYPEYRAPGSDKWERVTWDWALDRIAKLMKEDRDKNFLTKNQAGQTVNRWPTVGFLAASASSNESGHITGKFVRSVGMLAVDNQARL
jgi:formate dehydrogenase major subunit